MRGAGRVKAFRRALHGAGSSHDAMVSGGFTVLIEGMIQLEGSRSGMP